MEEVGLTHRVAFFDLDNTLVDRQAAFHEWASEWSEERDLPAEAADWLVENDDGGYRPRINLMKGVVDHFGVDDSPDDLVAEYRERLPAYFKPDQAVIDGLRRLRELGWKLAVVTNGPPKQRAVLASAGLAGEVDAVVVSSEVGARKPSPIIFQIAAEVLGVPSNTEWMAGDNPEADIQGAANAGLKTIWIARDRYWPLDNEPTITVETIREALNRLAQLSPYDDAERHEDDKTQGQRTSDVPR